MKLEKRKKGYKPSPFKNQSKSHTTRKFKRGSTQQSLPSHNANNPNQFTRKRASQPVKRTLQCWATRDPTCLEIVYSETKTQEDTKINDIARSPKIYAALEDK